MEYGLGEGKHYLCLCFAALRDAQKDAILASVQNFGFRFCSPVQPKDPETEQRVAAADALLLFAGPGAGAEHPAGEYVRLAMASQKPVVFFDAGSSELVARFSASDAVQIPAGYPEDEQGA